MTKKERSRGKHVKKQGTYHKSELHTARILEHSEKAILIADKIEKGLQSIDVNSNESQETNGQTPNPSTDRIEHYNKLPALMNTIDIGKL